MAEALATAHALERGGWNFSLGLAQVNRHNLPKYKLDFRSAFDPCSNLRAGASILKNCYDLAQPRARDTDFAWQMAYSCYYSGNFSTGFKVDFKGQPSYVHKVLANMGGVSNTFPINVERVQVRPVRKVPAALAKANKEVVKDAWAVFGAKEI